MYYNIIEAKIKLSKGVYVNKHLELVFKVLNIKLFKLYNYFKLYTV